MVTVPLPATIVPVTLVVLHPTPVQTEIGSALAVPWARETIPKIASASSDFFKVVNLGIRISFGVQNQCLLKSIQLEKSRQFNFRLGDESTAGQLRAQT